MGYRLAEQNGESVAVPRLVFAHLARADGDTIRAALYLLGGGGTDPRTMARDLGMPSIEAAKRAMQYWAGAGLLVRWAGMTGSKNCLKRSGKIIPRNNKCLCTETQAATKPVPSKRHRLFAWRHNKIGSAVDIALP